MTTGSGDFKYTITQLTKLYIGARCTYEEVLDAEDFSHKFRQIVSSKILGEVTADTTLESHLYYMTEEDASAAVYEKLRAAVVCSVRTVKKTLTGKEKEIFEEKEFKVEELCAIPPEEKNRMGIVIRELRLSKPAVMSFVI